MSWSFRINQVNHVNDKGNCSIQVTGTHPGAIARGPAQVIDPKNQREDVLDVEVVKVVHFDDHVEVYLAGEPDVWPGATIKSLAS